MPPAPYAPATAMQISAWVSSGMQPGSCAANADDAGAEWGAPPTPA